jgi:hypothetical protein
MQLFLFINLDAVTVVLYRLFEVFVTNGGTPKVEEVHNKLTVFCKHKK